RGWKLVSGGGHYCEGRSISEDPIEALGRLDMEQGGAYGQAAGFPSKAVNEQAASRGIGQGLAVADFSEVAGRLAHRRSRTGIGTRQRTAPPPFGVKQRRQMPEAVPPAPRPDRCP
ncbi:unnamed protein product, partial [Amoebophrya sp. A120]